jgi:hypothetical protein
MPLFRRAGRSGDKPAPTLQFTAGVRDHRVVVGGPERGCTMLDELRGYVASVTGDAAEPGPDGRDSVAVLSAKLDFAEMVDDAASAVALAVEELIERGVVEGDAVPVPPRPPAPSATSGHYAYIQEGHRRAEVRLEWLERVDPVLRAHGVAVLPPAVSGG